MTYETEQYASVLMKSTFTFYLPDQKKRITTKTYTEDEYDFPEFESVHEYTRNKDGLTLTEERYYRKINLEPEKNPSIMFLIKE